MKLVPLHLLRLAAATPETWITLPETSALAGWSVRQATESFVEEIPASGAWLLCLSGEAVVDSGGGAWARLQPNETLQLAEGKVQILPSERPLVMLRFLGSSS